MTINSKIIGVGAFLPPNIIKNKDLEQLLDTSNEWIVQRTGIEERRWADDDMATSDLAYEASIKAIKDAGIDKADIDMIIVATLSPDHEFPGVGVFLQAKLDIPNIACFDIRQQCTGFIYGLSMADKFIASGQHKNILLVGAEVQSKGLDKTPRGRNIGVLFGDGAGAVVVSATEVKDKSKDAHVMISHLHADGRYAKELWMAAPGTALGAERINHAMLDDCLNFAHMNGRAVFTNAIKKMAETVIQSCSELGLTPQDIDCFLFHQANMRINSKVAEVLEIDPEKVFNTIQKYGNTTAATIPIGLNDAIAAGALKPGMLVASAAFGSGFTWASTIFRY